jgi:hypothetical protein
VDMNLRELGRAAGEQLLAAIEGRPSAGVQSLPCSLVVRESSRPRQPVTPAPDVAFEASVANGTGETGEASGGAGGILTPAPNAGRHSW